MNIKNTCLHNFLKLPISHKRGMEIMCCSMMSHYLFYQYFYKHACIASMQACISDVLAIITKTITY